MAVHDLVKLCPPQFPQGLGQVIHDESVVVGEELHPHLGDFPARDVVVDAVKEGHVLPYHVGHWGE